MNAEELPAAALRRFHCAQHWFFQNDGPELRPHALDRGFDGGGHFRGVRAGRHLNVRKRINPAMHKPADIADGAVGDEHGLIIEISQRGKPQADFLHPAGHRDGAHNFHHVARVHRVRKNQGQADDHVLHQPLRTEADRQRENGGAGQVAGEVHAKFLQNQPQREKVHYKRHRTGNELDERDKLGRVGNEVQRALVGVAAADDPFRDIANNAHRYMHQHREQDDQNQPCAHGGTVAGKMAPDAGHYRDDIGVSHRRHIR